MLGVVRVPYMPTDVDRYMQQVAIDIGKGESFNKAPVGVYYGSPGVEAEDPYFAGVGPRRTGCVGCGNCMIGCGRNAKNKLNMNYLYLAESLGAQVHELHEVHQLTPLDGGGFEVRARHPGWAQRTAHLHHHRYTAEQVIVAAHAYGSAKLLHHMQHEGHLTDLSGQLGQRARTNSEQLLAVSPDRTTRLLQCVRDWLLRNARLIAAAIMVLLAIALLRDGISGLTHMS
jgi:cholesterol oxidase